MVGDSRSLGLRSVKPNAKSKGVFLTVFPGAENVHLAKDVGMLPTYMARACGYKAVLACAASRSYLPYADTIVPELEIRTIPPGPEYQMARRSDHAYVEFLREVAADIEVLQLFHFTRESIGYARAVRRCNPRAKIMIKADLNLSTARRWENLGRSRNPARILKKLYRHWWFCRYVDLMTIETKSLCEIVRRIYPAFRDRIVVMPNGIDDHFISRTGGDLDFVDKKERLILVVGRIGSVEKNHEMLLDALAGISDFGGWKVAFVGPVETRFQDKLTAACHVNPALRGALIVAGSIQDREILYSWYRRARLFCLTSPSEGFPLSLVDAIFHGCEVISTPIPCLNDLTDDLRFGRVVHDAGELRSVLREYMAGSRSGMEHYWDIRGHGENFRWSRIALGLQAHLEAIVR